MDGSWQLVITPGYPAPGTTPAPERGVRVVRPSGIGKQRGGLDPPSRQCSRWRLRHRCGPARNKPIASYIVQATGDITLTQLPIDLVKHFAQQPERSVRTCRLPRHCSGPVTRSASALGAAKANAASAGGTQQRLPGVPCGRGSGFRDNEIQRGSVMQGRQGAWWGANAWRSSSKVVMRDG
jgi:hypothetical protein